MKVEFQQDIDEIMHQPKSGMCATCVRYESDCADLDFDLMPVIERGQNMIIVRCTEWKKKK